MISIEEYRKIVSELLDELPNEFFKELNGGVLVSEETVIPDYARGNDLYTMGHYQVASGIRQITLFKGSFDRAYPRADADEARELVRGILRHEFRHHLESLGGVRNASSLEAEDARQKAEYLSRHSD
jgi:predicted Zn-dependent protease with MMP-like domain